MFLNFIVHLIEALPCEVGFWGGWAWGYSPPAFASLPTILHLACKVFSFWTTCCPLFLSETFSDGCLGSNTDEGRSEVWWALWIAEFREPIVTWMCIALSGYPWKHVCFSVYFTFCHRSHLHFCAGDRCACLWVKATLFESSLGSCSECVCSSSSESSSSSCNLFASSRVHLSFFSKTWSQTSKPAEFKHISKRRKRN